MNSERLGRAISAVVAVSLAVLGAMALGAAAFMAVFVWWPLAVAATGVGVIICVWQLRAPQARVPRIGWAAAALLVLAVSVGIGLLVPGIVRHDRVMDEVSGAICGPPMVPDGAAVRSCEAHGPENPSNGNSCGYFVELRLETSLSPEALRAFYASISLPRGLDGLTVTSPYAEAVPRSSTVHVSFLAVGDSGADPRCS